MSTDTRIGIFIGLAALAAMFFLWKDRAASSGAAVEEAKPSDRVRVMLTLLDSDAPSTRALAAAQLGDAPEAAESAEALAALKRVEDGDPDADVRTEAAVAVLRLMVREDYGPALARMLWGGRWSERVLYRRIGSLAEDQPQRVLDLLPALDSPQTLVRVEARVALARLSQDAAEALWQAAREGDDLGRRYAAMHALVLMDDRALPVLKEALDGPDRRVAVRVLEDLSGDNEARSPEQWKTWVSDRLKDPDDEDDPDGEGDGMDHRMLRTRGAGAGGASFTENT